jgi:hypothetical protein
MLALLHNSVESTVACLGKGIYATASSALWVAVGSTSVLLEAGICVALSRKLLSFDKMGDAKC